MGQGVEINLTTGEVRTIVVPDAPPLTPLQELDNARLSQKEKIAASRYAAETAGLVVNGSTVKTDRESQAMLTGAWVTVQMKPTALIDWKAENGWTKINKATVEALADAVSTHVQACFTRECQLSAQIDAARTVAAVETIIW